MQRLVLATSLFLLFCTSVCPEEIREEEEVNVVFFMTQDLYLQLNATLGEDLGLLFDQAVDQRILGTSQGNAVATDKDQKITLYTFVAHTELTSDGLEQQIKLAGHPEYADIVATFFAKGHQVLLEVTKHRQRPQRIALSSTP